MKYFVGFILLGLGIAYLYPLFFEHENVIEDVVMFTDNDKAVVQVQFSSPLRYENHYPETGGQFLQVKFRLVTPIQPSIRQTVSQEKMKTDVVNLTSLANISYEGNVPGGPLLTMLFTRPVEYDVSVSEDLESIIVEIPIQAPSVARSVSL